MASQKAKYITIGALVAVIAGVGAFQLTSGDGAAPKKASKAAKQASDQASADDEKSAEERASELLAQADPGVSRDPFAKGQLAPIINEPTKKPDQRSSPVRYTPRPRGPRIDDVSPIDVSGPLPGVNGGAEGGQAAGPKTTPSKPLRVPGEFTYQVSGVMMGRKPVAVLQGDDGIQRVVPIGGKIDDYSEVVGIERGRVVVRHRGKNLNLSLGGNSRGN